jgi:hypothetical protein
MRYAPRFLLLAALLVVVAACGPRRTGPVADESAQLRVQNNSFLDMRIYVVGSGPRIRLGMVNGSSSATLRIPAHVIGMGRDVHFLADPIGSPTVAQSFSIYVRPGENVSITIPPTVR